MGDIQNSYTNSVKFILDEYNVVPSKLEYVDDIGDLMSGCSLLQDFLSAEFYNITDSNDVFHDKNLIKFLKEYPDINKNITLKESLQSNKKTILCFMMHPRGYYKSTWNYKTHFFDKLFKNEDILKNIKNGNLVLLLNFGVEADNFHIENDDYLGNYSEVFKNISDTYNLPNNSVIILSSNLKGNPINRVFNVIYDNILEYSSFKDMGRNYDFNYTFDDYISNIKNASKFLLRINRTPALSRDAMMWYLYMSNNIDNCLIEHRYIEQDIMRLKYELEFCRNACDNLNLKNIKQYFEFNSETYSLIQKNLPHISSEYEKNNKIFNIYSNERIPEDVYSNTVLSWVSTTFAEKNDQVFLNASTFNPILNYHPLVYHGNYEIISYLKKMGFKSYDFLYNESDINNSFNSYERFVLSVNNINNILLVNTKKIIDIIIDNRSIMEYNRQKLIECSSIYRILTGISNILKTNG